MLEVGDIVRRNREYRGSDFGYNDRENPNYYSMEGKVVSKTSVGVPLILWNIATADSFTYPNYKQSLIKVIKKKKVEDMSLPDGLFEI